MRYYVAAIIAVGMTVAACGRSGPKDVTGAPTLESAAASLGCTDPEADEPADHVRLGTGFLPLPGQVGGLATFASDTLQRNWEKIATQFAPLIKDGPGWAAVQG